MKAIAAHKDGTEFYDVRYPESSRSLDRDTTRSFLDRLAAYGYTVEVKHQYGNYTIEPKVEEFTMPNTNVGRDTPGNEPPEVTPCAWCDGQQEVDVYIVIIADGTSRDVPRRHGRSRPTIKCPRCDGSGAEPIRRY